MKNIFLVLLFFCVAVSYAYGNIIYTNYINREDFPVKITVPYYSSKSNKPQNLEIELQQGDFYEARKGKNGIVYPKYGLMPDMVKSILPEEICHDDKNKESYLRKLENTIRFKSTTNMPNDWIYDSQTDFKSHLSQFEQFKTNSNWILYKQAEFNKMLLSTNISEESILTLSNPDGDPDGDGFINRKEAECGTNPLLFNDFIIGPKYFAIESAEATIVTGRFFIINNSYTNYHVHIYMSCSNKDDGKVFNPRLYCYDDKSSYGPNDKFSFDIAPKTGTNLLFLVNADSLPNTLQISIRCFAFKGIRDISNDCFYDNFVLPSDMKDISKLKDILVFENEIRPVLKGFSCPSPSKPLITSPPNGSCFTSIDKVNFKWKDDKFKNKNDGEYVAYEVQSYVLSDDCKYWKYNDFLRKKGDYRAVLDTNLDWFYDRCTPSLCVWRVVKATASDCCAYSDWQWFVIGKEIGPKNNVQLKIKNETVIHKIKLPILIAKDYNFNKDFVNLHSYESYYNKPPFQMYFVNPLPKGILQKKPRRTHFYPFYLRIEEDADIPIGTYTNRLVVSDGETTLTNTHIFIIKKDFE